MTEEFKESQRRISDIIYLPDEELDKFIEERKKLNENSPKISTSTLTDEDRENLWAWNGSGFVKYKDYYHL